VLLNGRVSDASSGRDSRATRYAFKSLSVDHGSKQSTPSDAARGLAVVVREAVLSLEDRHRDLEVAGRLRDVDFGFGFDDEEGVGVRFARGSEFLAGVVEGVG
jgi:hypothetical protein